VSTTSRVRLAQELHDGIAQDLVGLSYFIDSLVAKVNTPNELRADLRALRFSVTDVIERVRHEIFELRLTQPIEDSAHTSDKNYELSRVFNELIRNIDQHAQAHSVTVTISDDGVGGAQTKEGHDGIRGASERIVDLGGKLSIDSANTGTRIVITVPWIRS
jgi:NarL family two-component system sensor histidine kinase LiaS